MDETGLPMDLGLSFRASQIIASLLFGVVGLYVFRYGKKQVNYPIILSSLALMIYPMFTSSWLEDWGVGIALCGLAYYFDQNANLTG